MVEKNSNIELRSEEVEDILGKVPGWVTRNGISMLFLLIILLLLGSWIFQVPDVKKAEIYVTSLQPAAYIESRSDGKIEKLLVIDNEKVEGDQVLAVIESPADFHDVNLLKRQLPKFSLVAEKLPELKLQINDKANLGMIQPDYAAFYKYYRDYKEFLQLDYHRKKTELLEDEHEQYIKYSGNLDTRAKILEEEYELARNQYLRDSILFLQGVVSESDFENTKSKTLSALAEWQAMVSLKTENDMKIAGIREQILELELKREEQRTSLTTSLEEAMNRLKASIST